MLLCQEYSVTVMDCARSGRSRVQVKIHARPAPPQPQPSVSPASPPSLTRKMQIGLCFDGDKMMDCDTADTLCIKGLNVTELPHSEVCWPTIDLIIGRQQGEKDTRLR